MLWSLFGLILCFMGFVAMTISALFRNKLIYLEQAICMGKDVAKQIKDNNKKAEINVAIFFLTGNILATIGFLVQILYVVII